MSYETAMNPIGDKNGNSLLMVYCESFSFSPVLPCSSYQLYSHISDKRRMKGEVPDITAMKDSTFYSFLHKGITRRDIHG
jgi:hypothetical protein